jgi:hypothetical protein
MTISEMADGRLIVDAGQVTHVVIDPDSMTVTGGSGDPNDAGYPDVIVDQRTGYGLLGGDSTTVADVETLWETYCHRHDRPVVDRADEVVAYINASRWVADCPCGGAMFCWDRNPRACCLDCGSRYPVRWQPPAVRAAVIRTLAARPEPARNWDPRRVDEAGELLETVEFLRRENVLMGVE